MKDYSYILRVIRQGYGRTTWKDAPYNWWIEGFSIFVSQNVRVPLEQDPRLVFLHYLAEHHPCSAHVGILALEGEAPQEAFGPPEVRTTYSRSLIGVYSGEFYEVEPQRPACYFPRIQRPLLNASLERLEYLVRCDALALYVDPQEGALEKMRMLLHAPFPGHREWIHAVTALYRLLVISMGDGWYFVAFAQDSEAEQMLQPALSHTAAVIESTAWYQTNKERLVWDADRDQCLKLPESLSNP